MEFERERSQEEAERHFHLETKKLCLDFELKKFGNLPAQTTACTLICNRSKKRMCEGGGKGIGKQSELSAKFEALEVFTGQVGNVSSPYESFSLCEIQSLNVPILASHIFPEFLAADFPRPREKLPWIPYRRYGSNEPVFIPAVCTHPFYCRNPFPDDRFDYSALYHSLTTNGIASGCTQTEAMIHALLETIERHSLSLFMIETFLKQQPKFPKIIDLQTLPEREREIASHVIQTTGLNLLLFQMPNEMGIPVYGTLLYYSDLPYPIKGSGASFDPAYAIQRSLLEAMEIYHWDQKNVELEMAIEWLEAWPALKQCAAFDLLSFAGNIPLSPFLNAHPQIHSPEEGLERITSKLASAGFSIYFHEVYRSENLTTVRVIVPEAEEFFSVIKGLVVPIKEKGRAVLYA